MNKMDKKGFNNIVVIVLLTVLALLTVIIFWNILSPLIKEKTGQIDITAFKKSLEVEEAKTPISAESKTEECISNWQCGEWSECGVTYSLDDLIEEEVLLNGERQRECEDLNKCFPNKIEKEKCDTKVSITVKKVVVCSKEYIEIRDDNGILISRLELTDGDFPRMLNIQLLLGEVENCP